MNTEGIHVADDGRASGPTGSAGWAIRITAGHLAAIWCRRPTMEHGLFYLPMTLGWPPESGRQTRLEAVRSH
jgi:hypothetical protein